MRLMTIVTAAFWAAVWLNPAAADPIFYLNAHGGSRYTIGRYVGSVPSPTRPVIDARNDGGSTGVAWPTAFKLTNGTTRIFASRTVDGKWSDVGVWAAQDGVDFTFEGIALSANPEEPSGIGPSTLAYKAGDATPWKMIYLVRSAPIGSTFVVADSVSGAAGTWTRRGIAMSASEPWEAAGITPSYIFMDAGSGKWVLLYHAYETVQRAYAAMATADNPEGPYNNKRILMAPIGSRILISGGAKGTNFASVPVSPILGHPYVLRQASPLAIEVVVPTKYIDGIVYFDRPLIGSYPSGEMAHVATNKVDPSFVSMREDGTWHGIWTGYGQYDGVTSEYTFEVSAPRVEGPWTVMSNGVAFEPWTPFGVLSTENPTPVTAAE